MYYSFDKLFSFPFMFAFCVGSRGCGKTFNAKVWCLNRFLKTGEQFVYLRRYKTELDPALSSFFDDLQSNGYFEDYELKVCKSKMLTSFKCNGQVCGYAAALSTANILKSTAFPKVTTIIFDEYILDTACGVYKYLRDEPTQLLEFVESVFRLRNGHVLFLGNCVNFYGCPYTGFFNLSLPYNSEFKSFKEGLIVVNYIDNEQYRNVKKQTKFGRLVEGTKYADYAIDNKSLRESEDFIEKRPPDSKFNGILVINGTNIGVWSNKNGNLYLSEKYEPNHWIKLACDFNDHTDSTQLLSLRENWIIRYTLTAFKRGWCRFENQKVKAVALPLLNKCIAI